MKLNTFCCLFLFAFFSQFSNAASVTVGNYDTANAHPFGNFAANWGVGAIYQQVYSAASFSSAMSIDGVSFFKADSSIMDNASYSVSFYLTSAAPNGLNTTAANNRGALLSNFGTFSFSGATPNVLTLNGGPFTYDPFQGGNLLMQVVVSAFNTAGGTLGHFQADNGSTETSRYFGGSSGFGTAASGGLVTEFSYSVPEPSAFILLSVGFIGFTLMRKTK
ncbi:MAG: PEP-CTERM sorting domain-containing protein [Methylovulum miyakonense]|uniref:PEP-CTERM sorting domain-containing protein n=1 Tax=Methylovulum miyakonense TaxID=645578 RepID=UPI003BB754D0